MCKKMIFLITVALAVGLVAERAAADLNPIAYWSFNNAGDPGHDDSGNGRDLTMHGAAAHTAGGKSGGAITFPGQNTAYLEDGDGENYINGLDAVTVGVWIKSGEINTDRGFFTTRDPAGPDGKQCLGMRYDPSGDSEDRVIKFYVMTTQDKGLYESPGEVQTTEWQHVVITWGAAGGRSELYIDGELQKLSRRETESGAGEPLGGTLANATMVRVGTGFKNMGWLGLVDEVCIYDRALSEVEVLHLFDPNVAWNPSPRHLAENLCGEVELSWSPGENAVSHDVYFGTSLSDVNESATAVKEAHDTNSYPVSVELGLTHYWRIDEVSGADTWTGKIWMFTANDGNAFDPHPADGQSEVSVDPTLRWTPGCLATSHDVYFGTSWGQVNGMTDPCATKVLGEESYNPDTLDYLSWYYWRIDEVDGGDTWRGKVWSFKTKSGIIDPNMLLWFEFDETPGSPDFVRDSSGYDYHGDGDDFDEDTWDANDGRCYAGSLNMDSDQRVDITAEVLDNINHEVSVSVWLKGAKRPGHDNWLFGSGSGEYHLAAAVPDDAVNTVIWKAGDDSNDSLIWEGAAPAAWLPDWHHFVFIKNENTATMSIWLDGSLADSIGDVDTDTLANVKNAASKFRIGANWENSDDFIGKVDDFRIFDYELSEVEIQSLCRCGDIEKAWAPRPYDGETDVARDVSLIWKPGDNAASHDVYFGTDWEDVNDAVTVSSEYKGNREPNSYDPVGNLELGAAYYWRIDEVNEGDGGSLWRGNVWRFTVANFLIIDDMETYITGDPLSQRIYNTWLDGFSEENNTGSELDLGQDPAHPVHGGDQSMKYTYDNADSKGWDLDYYSEISVDALKPNLKIGSRDWTQPGVKILTMFFYGDPENDAGATEQMYAGLEDTRGAGSYAQVDYGCYGESMSDIQEAEWHQWDIGMPDFTGVDANNVSKLYIGFGIRGNPNPEGTPGGNGTVYFDNIRLYRPKCLPERLKPAADFTDDCTVDLADVGEMVEEWLRTDVNLPTQNPGAAGLVGWWKLDEGSGNIANDSSPSGTHHGTISGDYAWVVGHNDVNSAVEFEAGKVLVPDAVELRPPAWVSACAWVKYFGDPGDSARVVVKGRNDMEAYCIEMGDDDSVVYYVGDVNGNRYYAESDEGDAYAGEWIHLAGTYDGLMVKCYVNGQVVATNDEANSIPLSQDPDGLGIGNRADANNRAFEGTIDEVRVYNRALSAAEVAYVATDGTGYVPLNSEKNLYDEEPAGSKAINFRDIDVLLDEWLDERVWPE